MNNENTLYRGDVVVVTKSSDWQSPTYKKGECYAVAENQDGNGYVKHATPTLYLTAHSGTAPYSIKRVSKNGVFTLERSGERFNVKRVGRAAW